MLSRHLYRLEVFTELLLLESQAHGYL